MPDELTPEQTEALRIARTLIDAGIPVFAAAPCPDNCATQGHQRTEYHLPKAWQKITPSYAQLRRWKPGWALAAMGGHAGDWLDEDSYIGGDVSVKELKEAGQWPEVFAVAGTPSGGRHYLISPLHEREANKFMPGLDYQGGDDAGEGRAFVWLTPTVKRSKNNGDDGALRAYSWIVEPDLDALKEAAARGDESGRGVIERLRAHRGESIDAVETAESAENPPETIVETPESPGFSDVFMTSSRASADPRTGNTPRQFTVDSAWEFVQPVLRQLRESQIGSIEPDTNRAAAMLSHFVPAFMSADQAFAILCDALSHTAYDPNHPQSTWHADKFRAVLDGRRAPRDNWKAEKIEADSLAAKSVQENAELDDVDALIGRMLTAEQIIERPAPDPLVWGLLDRDSLASIVGLPGSFKSFVALDLAGHIGSGKEWHGRRVHQGLCVVIVAEGERGMTLRARAWVKKNGPMSNVLFLPEPVQIGDPRAWDVLVKACERLKPVFVVVDTQSMVTLGLEENSNTEMNVAMGAFRRIQRASGACVMPIHHTTKDGSGVRGGSAQEGAHDTRLRLARLEPRSSMVVKLTDEKQKDMAEGDEPIRLVMDVVSLGTDPHTGRSLSSLVVAERDAYLEASGEEVKPTETERTAIQEPQPWAVTAGGTEIRARLLQAVLDVGQGAGTTMAEARRDVAARWYGGKQVESGSAGLNRSTFNKAWKGFVTEALESENEPVFVSAGGERWRINPVRIDHN